VSRLGRRIIVLVFLVAGWVAGEASADGGFAGVLSDADTDRYRRIFALQEDGDWKAADRRIADLGDRVLMGHVLAQRYFHPTKYRSRYKELKAWMAAHADHPDAHRIYKLALKRRPKNWRRPDPPAPPGTGKVASTGSRAASAPGGKALSQDQRRRVAQLKRQMRWHLRKGWTKAVKKRLKTEEVQRLFSAVEYDEYQARLGAGYFAAGRDEWALLWAGRAAKRSGARLPEAHWTAGLAAWRLGRFEDAAGHFEHVAAAEDTSDWMLSAGAFWAARAHLVSRRPQHVNAYLGEAADHPRTFYGLLARHILGLPAPFRWAVPPAESSAVHAILAEPAGLRAAALIRVGEMKRAERELRALARGADPALARGILVLASLGDMPALAVTLNEALFPGGGGFDGAAFPVPSWEPKGGFRVDRALIYAVIRQESRFNPKAKSYAGARGLMQLMPGTASFIARDRKFRGRQRKALYTPEVNLDLGQRYMEHLLGNAEIGADLFMLATAWNGGPGNLKKWRREIRHMDDPLFFIESIPHRETRIFIERVLTNLWIYRHRLGQPTPSLDGIAAGDWPVYKPLDDIDVEVADHGQDRG
jgi:soluble lytic murein transglycosylase-like protein